MKGAKADPFAITRRMPNVNKKKTIGMSHHFFRTLRKAQNSLRMESLPFIMRECVDCSIKWKSRWG